MLPLEKNGLSQVRKKLLIKAKGDILEIGPGTGVNLKYYDSEKVQSLTQIDLKIAESLKEKGEKNSDFPVDLIEGSVEELPFCSRKFDCVVVTLVFCSVVEVNKALQEIKRVLKDDGIFIFIEHVLSNNTFLAKIENVLNTPWKSFAGGCNLNRETRKSIERNGFQVLEFDTGWKGIMISGIEKKNPKA